MRSLIVLLALGGAAAGASAWTVGPVPDAVRAEFKLDDFYRKHVEAAGFAIVGSAKVSDFALREAAYVLTHMMAGREDLLRAMRRRGGRVAVMAWNEYTTDVPEHRGLAPRIFWDRRARGLGGSPVSCGEENLLCYPGDPYAEECLLIHEFAHAVHGVGLRAVAPDFDRCLTAAYESAMARGLWKGTYAATNAAEYWAEGVQDWFDDNRENDALHNHVNTRAELMEYDSGLAALCAEVFGANDWRYVKPHLRPPEGRAHLEGFDRSKAPRFRWREEAVGERPRVLIQTALGDVEIELETRRVPEIVKTFLDGVHEGLYSDKEFFPTVAAELRAGDEVEIEVVGPRAEGDAGRDRFFFRIGGRAEPDSGEARLPDGPRRAAFGRVVEGREVVRAIHAARAQGRALAPPVPIQRAIRLR